MFPRIHLSIERWRKNEEYGVWVSNMGHVRLIKNKQRLEPRIGRKGYCKVFTEQGPVSVHRLVAYTWLGDMRNEKYTVDHINSNKRDNSVKNLRWVSKEINEQYAAFMSADVIEEDGKTETCEEEREHWIMLLKDTSRSRKKNGELLMLALDKEYVKLFRDGEEIKGRHGLNEAIKKWFPNAATEEICGRIVAHARNHTPYGAADWRIPEIES